MRPTGSPDPVSGGDDDRFSRQLALPGFDAATQARLAAARVLVIGAGGLGSAVLPMLASMGVGVIGVVDDDRVETSNLHRQTLHAPTDVGRAKVASAAATLRSLAPTTEVIEHPVRLDSGNALEIAGGYDLLVDGSDNFATRYLANDVAALLGIPLVWGAVSQFSGQAGCVLPGSPDYRDLFPVPPAPGAVPSCADGGVFPAVCAIVGGILVGEVVKLIGGLGTPLVGRVALVDALAGTADEVRFARDPDRAPITGLIDYDAFCGLPAADELVTPRALRDELRGATPPRLVDVREPDEVALATLAGATLIPLPRLEAAATATAVMATPLALDEDIVVLCHHGVRSRSAASTLRALGFTRVRELAGGIDAWAADVDPEMRRY
ncbi:adenylyltransferase/sulfurtransferase MoeZ [Schumannella luteola]|uniref:Adenylyltransferase/sulfurtransferase n=1 Tax=Schumannella luteola TaxID=472059 RepID=A0A852YPF8_9MICO|nr:ThiF family adenylyltransferase [Schumannella luteola]NYG99095.1 adenylyltransferase/sulfurtransferase [Schumannella luteola]TPX06443.1 molybdopterin biosynthesis protein MoeB [Schumannella luteola]